MTTQNKEQKLLAYMPFYGVSLEEMLRLASEKDAMVRKYCALVQVTDEVESYVSCRVSAVLVRWDARNMRPHEWDAEKLRPLLWRACANARLDSLRRQNTRKRNGLIAPAKQDDKTKIYKKYYRGHRHFCGV